MKLLGRKKDNAQAAVTAASTADPDAEDSQRTATAPKGRPTPKRNEAARKRGPVAPAPMTTAEARTRRKELGGPKLSPRGDAAPRRSAPRATMTDRREKMMAGDDAYLLPRDKGPVRRFVRDIVDSRRNVLGLFMPAALALIFVMLAIPQVQLLHLARHAGPDARSWSSTASCSAARSTSWSTPSSRTTPKVGWKLGLLRRQPRLPAAPDARATPQVNRGDKVA